MLIQKGTVIIKEDICVPTWLTIGFDDKLVNNIIIIII